jgi:hypothetical protein
MRPFPGSGAWLVPETVALSAGSAYPPEWSERALIFAVAIASWALWLSRTEQGNFASCEPANSVILPGNFTSTVPVPFGLD